jgi:hypothetical protein
LVKQKDGPSNVTRGFVLKRVVLNIDADGDEVSSCIVEPTLTAMAAEAASKASCPPGYATMHPKNQDIFRCLIRALRKVGVEPPPEIKAPNGTLAIKVGQWQDELIELIKGHEEITPQMENRVKQRIRRASEVWLPDRVNLIVKSGHWVWRTHRKVHQIDPPPLGPKPEAEPLLAPGETAKDVADLLGKD